MAITSNYMLYQEESKKIISYKQNRLLGGNPNLHKKSHLDKSQQKVV